MTAQLGETRDPVRLVPGSVSNIEAAVAQWQSQAATASGLADDLRVLRTVHGWTGKAAEAYQSRIGSLAAEWEKTETALTTAANALETYSVTLGWAQQKADDAIQMYENARQLTATSSTSAVPAWTQMGKRSSKIQILPPKIDPGASERADAESLLAYAREQVDQAGTTAATAIRKAGDIPKPGPDIWQVAELLGLGMAAAEAVPLWNGFADAVNGVASFGNALLQHPDELGEILGGLGMLLGGGAIIGAGGGYSLATAGVGAVAGGEAAVVGGAAVIGAGGAAIGDGVMKAAQHASTDDAANPVSKHWETQPRDARGRFTGQGGRPWEDAETEGLNEAQKDYDNTIIRDKVRAKINNKDPRPGEKKNLERYFDGLVKNPDGKTYTGIEIKSGGAGPSSNQRIVERLIRGGDPATVRLPDGQIVKITKVASYNVRSHE